MQQHNQQTPWENAVAINDVWGVPDLSVLNGGRQSPPKLPIEVFGAWDEWICSSAEAKSAPPDYVATGLLTSAAALIGNSRWGSPWFGWSEPTVLWTALVGLPSSGKSPALDSTMDLMLQLQEEIAGDYPDLRRTHETEREAAKVAMDAWKVDVKEADGRGAAPPQMPERALEPGELVLPRLVVTDPTVEALARLLSGNPRGLLYKRDELAGWFQSFQRYSAGSDRPFWIEAFGGRAHTVDRLKNMEPTRVPYLSVSIIGGVQPDRLHSLLMDGGDDGLASRFLMTWPEPTERRIPTTIPSDEVTLRAFRRLHSLQMSECEKGNLKPVTLPFEDEAAGLLNEARQDLANEERRSSGLYLSHLGKMPGLIVRISVVLEHLWWSLDGASSPPVAVSRKAVANAIGLTLEYFRPMAARCYGDAVLPEVERNAAAIARRIVEDRLETVNAREIYREWRLPNLRKAKPVKDTLEFLYEANWLMPAGNRLGGTTGAKKDDYSVNPKVLEGKHG